MMSRSRQVPPGQGLGKLICCSYSTSPLLPPCNSVGETCSGVAIFADATSVKTPYVFFHQPVLRVAPGQYASKEYPKITPDFPASSRRKPMAAPVRLWPHWFGG